MFNLTSLEGVVVLLDPFRRMGSRGILRRPTFKEKVRWKWLSKKLRDEDDLALFP